LRICLALAVVALLATACGGGGSSPAGPVVPPAANVILRVGATAARPSVLIDEKGRTLYVSRLEANGQQHCTGKCLQVWPLVLLSAHGRAGSGNASIKPSDITVATVPEGRAVAFRGHLLHSYVGDTSPGANAGEGAGGEWSTITPGGRTAL
jgi:predicted lipoprotein with Yx(FWY)xxD motif